MANNLVESIIGALVLAVAAGFVFYAYSHSGAQSATGYVLGARFTSIDGLNPGADVRISGIKVGQVVGQRLDEMTFQAVVNFRVADRIELPDDSSIKIASEGLLGGSYLAIEPGGSENLLKQGDEIRYTQGAVDLFGLIGQAVFSNTGSGGGDSPAAPAPAAADGSGEGAGLLAPTLP